MPRVKKPADFWRTAHIIQDSREQRPYVFPRNPVVVGTLRTGDYTVSGLEHLVCVERKSQGDYWGCLAKSRRRFVAELERMKDIPWSLVIIECSPQQMCEGYFYNDGYSNRRSKVSGETALNSALFWMMAYPSIRFMLADDREHGEWIALNWLRMALRYQRHREREAKRGPAQG